MTEHSVQRAQAQCLQVARHHYENFPVASILLPRAIRPAVASLYAFARTADDLADEGDLNAQQRLQQLDDLQSRVTTAARPDDPLMQAVAKLRQQYDVDEQPFIDLISAFKQDVSQTRYANIGELMDYCRRSANPVGRVLLKIFSADDERNRGYSDALCTALQLINFYQDLKQDFHEHNRIYLPLDEMQRFGVTEADIAAGQTTPALRALMQFQYQRARQLLQASAPLGRRLRGRIGLETRLIIAGGSRILQRLYENQSDVFARPRLRIRDKLWMLGKALR